MQFFRYVIYCAIVWLVPISGMTQENTLIQVQAINQYELKVFNTSTFPLTLRVWPPGKEAEAIELKLNPLTYTLAPIPKRKAPMLQVFLSESSFQQIKSQLLKEWSSAHNRLIAGTNIPEWEILIAEEAESHPCYPCYFIDIAAQSLASCFPDSKEGVAEINFSSKSSEIQQLKGLAARLKELYVLRESSQGLAPARYDHDVVPFNSTDVIQGIGNFQSITPSITFDLSWPFAREISYPSLSDEWRADTMAGSISMGLGVALFPEVRFGKSGFGRLYLDMRFQRFRWMARPEGQYFLGESMFQNLDPGFYPLSDPQYLRLNVNQYGLGLKWRFRLGRFANLDIGGGLAYQTATFNLKSNASTIWQEQRSSARNRRYDGVFVFDSPFAPYGLAHIQIPFAKARQSQKEYLYAQRGVYLFLIGAVTVLDLSQGELYQIYQASDGTGDPSLVPTPFTEKSVLVSSLRLGFSLDLK